MAWNPATLKISDAEYRARCDALRRQLGDATGVVLFDADYIKYYTGFAFIPTERPIVFAMNTAGERALFVPRLEVEHAQGNALIDLVGHYREYPGETHPMTGLATMLADMNIKTTIAADQDGYPWVFGYQGPALSAVTKATIELIRPVIESQMAIKSTAEIGLIHESSKWANLAHQLLQDYTRPGLTETEVTQRASDEATRAMTAALGPIYRGNSPYYTGAVANYRGQIGRNAAIPHALAANIRFQPGDVLVTGASAPVWGYHTELERTMFIGKPTDQQKRVFDHMVAVQEVAFENIRPGRTCADVDVAVRKYYDVHGLNDYWKHHTGHAIGLRYHEGPFLDTGDITEIRPGMVFTVEPGLYAANLGGYRHSDTVVVTETGIDLLTFYPRMLEALIIPV